MNLFENLQSYHESDDLESKALFDGLLNIINDITSSTNYLSRTIDKLILREEQSVITLTNEQLLDVINRLTNLKSNISITCLDKIEMYSNKFKSECKKAPTN